MGLLDVFKKKSADVSVSPGTSLDNLPPVPQNPDSSDTVVGGPIAPDANVGLPPGPIEKTTDPLADTSLESTSLTTGSANSSQEPESGLEVPFLDELNNIKSLDNTSTTDLSKESSTVISSEIPTETSSQVEAPLASDNTQKESEPVEATQEGAEDMLPNFDELNEEISQERVGEQLAFDSGSSVDVKTESLLLKSIFVEREHYANILFSLKRVKDDLKKSAPQQRKLSHVDMKLGKEYAKLSTSYENFNENLMIIEHILSNEQF